MDHWFSTFAKFSEKLTLITHVRVRIRGYEMLVFRNFCKRTIWIIPDSICLEVYSEPWQISEGVFYKNSSRKFDRVLNTPQYAKSIPYVSSVNLAFTGLPPEELILLAVLCIVRVNWYVWYSKCSLHFCRQYFLKTRQENIDNKLSDFMMISGNLLLFR